MENDEGYERVCKILNGVLDQLKEQLAKYLENIFGQSELLNLFYLEAFEDHSTTSLHAKTNLF